MLAHVFQGVLALCSLSLQGATALSCSETKQLQAFISEELPVALHGVLANIGPDGSRVNGAAAGAVVASPSRTDPDYWYTWTRDSALTLKVLIERFIDGDETLQHTIEQYIAASAKLQGVTNPSGTPLTGGLGEPKFQVNLTEFTGPWGRPQRDGPALRATALTEYSNWLLARGRRVEAAENVWPVIDKDLAYTVKYWNRTGFDLWEEINGSSFFTLAASHRALVEGSALAKSLNKSCVDCDLSAPRVLCFLQDFFTASTASTGYIDSNINVQDGRTGKDANSLISCIHTFDPESACDDSTFQPCSARALANHKAVVDSFRSIYTVNSNATAGKAAAIGRYAEDVYYNGNPWYITTLAAAEQLYAAIYQWKKIKSIDITDVSLPFFQDVMRGVSKGTYDENSQTFRKIIKAVRIYADGFFYIVKQHTPADGSLAEQFDRNTGLPKSAVHLTWSYAAFVSAATRRSGAVPPSWGASGANRVPAVCVAAPTCDASMTFNVKVTTVPGETIVLVGSITELKNWSPPDGIPLDASHYTTENPVWTVTVKVPADTIFEYKYIKKSADGSIMWESDPNNQATSASGCGSSGTVNDQWR